MSQPTSEEPTRLCRVYNKGRKHTLRKSIPRSLRQLRGDDSLQELLQDDGLRSNNTTARSRLFYFETAYIESFIYFLNENVSGCPYRVVREHQYELLATGVFYTGFWWPRIRYYAYVQLLADKPELKLEIGPISERPLGGASHVGNHGQSADRAEGKAGNQSGKSGKD